MEKPYQIQDKTGIYFITFAVVEWVDIFTRQCYRDIVVDSLRYCQKEKGLIIYAWCVMSNHLHLILGAKEGNDLSGILRDFKKFTSKKIIETIQTEAESRRNWMLWLFGSAGERNKRNTNYQFWRQDNHAELLFGNEFTQQKLDYLHNNPVEAGLVDMPRDWLYSSARDYTGEKGLLEVQFIE
jgi:putative transposase